MNYFNHIYSYWQSWQGFKNTCQNVLVTCITFFIFLASWQDFLCFFINTKYFSLMETFKKTLPTCQLAKHLFTFFLSFFHFFPLHSTKKKREGKH